MDDNSLANINTGDLASALDNPEFLAALYAADTGMSADGMPKLFEADTFLMGMEIAGANFRPLISLLYQQLEEGERLTLLREPNNEYDERAIAVLTQEGKKLGYIPRVNNLILSRLMDAGYVLYALVRSKELQVRDKPDYRIVIKVYLTAGIKNPAPAPQEQDKEDERKEISALRDLDRLSLLKKGIQAAQNGKSTLAAAALQRYLESDTPEQLYELAKKYYDGEETEYDCREAIYWAEKAAAGGCAKAYRVLFDAFYYGSWQLKQDEKNALPYAQLGAEKGDMVCQHTLGSLYLDGKLVEQDTETAVHWFEKALEQGCFEAGVDLFVIYCSDKYGREDEDKALECALAAFRCYSPDSGDSARQYGIIAAYIGTRLYGDVDLQLPEGNAIFFFEEAAKNKYSIGLFFLGIMYFTGDECEKDEEKAKEYIDLAAEYGHQSAAEMKENGYVFPEDVEEFVEERTAAVLAKEVAEAKKQLDESLKDLKETMRQAFQ